MGNPSVVKVIVAWRSLRVIIVPWTRTALIVVSWVRMPPKIIESRILVIVNGRIELLRRPSSGPSLLQLLLILLLILLLMQLLIHQRR